MNQATVRTWSADSGGEAFLDDGTVVELPPQCLQGSAFRFVRPGQRVRLVREGGVVVRVDLPA